MILVVFTRVGYMTACPLCAQHHQIEAPSRAELESILELPESQIQNTNYVTDRIIERWEADMYEKD